MESVEDTTGNLCRHDSDHSKKDLWPPNAKIPLIGKDSDAGKDWGQEKGTTENEMAG